MTIKQLGGVFGRNPTFNDVTIEGQLTFDGDIDINSDLKVDGDLDVTGNAGIGIDAGTDVLQISDSAPIIKAIAENGNSGLRINVTGDSSNTLRVQSNGASKIELNGNNLKINSGSLQIANAGSGIDFSATAGTGTSELLDDYEEGIHTATLTPTTSGTIGLAGSANSLSYTKIGNMVNVTGYLYVSAISSPVGAINVSLPFAAADLTDGAGGSAAALSLTNIVSANVSDFVGRISETSSDLALYLGSSNNISATSAQQMQVGSQIQISVTYRTA